MMSHQPDTTSPGGIYDLSEKGSERNSEEATAVARKQDSDDANENTNPGQVSSGHGGSDAENKVATSLDDE